MNVFNDSKIFRAYAPSKNKIPQGLNADGSSYNLKYANVPNEELPGFGDIEPNEVEEAVGFLRKDIVVVDIDNIEQSEILMDVIEDLQLECLVIETTSGSHFHFKNTNEAVTTSHVDKQTAIGIKVDYRVGSKNGLTKIKQHGEFQNVIWEPLHELQEIPKFLFPVDSSVDFFDMKEGDGRNQSLFNHILTLQSAGLTKEEAKETLQLINGYILAEPLPESELEVIMRDEAFNKPIFFKKNKFLFDQFANYLANEYNIKRINGRLHIYFDGVYTPYTNMIENRMIQTIPTLSKSQRNEVISYLEILKYQNIDPSPPHLILFRSGVLNVLTGEVTENTPNHIFTNQVPHDYNPNAYSKLADDTLNKIACGDKEIRMLIEEMIGSIFYRSNTLGSGKAFLLTGDKSNGKSTLLSVIQKILGDDNISALDLKELSERFKTAELFGKLANIGDDISSEYIPDTSMFKKLVTGERVNAERKGIDPFEFNNYAKLLFSANDIPRFGKGSDSGAVARRLVIIPFNATFSRNDDDYNPAIKYDLQQQESIEYFIRIGVEGLKRVLNNREYTESKVVEKELEDFEASNDPLQTFINYREEIETPITDRPIREELYREYTLFCNMNQYQAYSQKSFTSRMKKKLNLDTKQVRTVNAQGKRVRDSVFIEK